MPALLPTTLVGSYPQPDWLIDRAPEFAAVLRGFVEATPLVRDGAGPYNPRP